MHNIILLHDMHVYQNFTGALEMCEDYGQLGQESDGRPS